MRTIEVTPSRSGIRQLMTEAQWGSLIRRSVESWNEGLAECCSVRLSVAQPSERWSAADDGINLIAFRSGAWCHNERCGHKTTFPLGALAMTTGYPEGASGLELREADVEINATRLDPSTLMLAASDGVDPVALQAVVTHELGHVLGLRDACVHDYRVSGRPIVGDCPADQRDRAMYASARKLAPTAGDLSELVALYPASGSQLGEPTCAGSVGYWVLSGVLLAVVGGRFAWHRWTK